MKIRYVTAIFPLCEKHWSTKLTEMKIFNILILSCFSADICFPHNWCLNITCTTMSLVCIICFHVG